MAMASLENLLHHAGRSCIRYHQLGTARTLTNIQYFTYCSTSSSPSSPTPEEAGEDSSKVKVVSYAPKPKPPEAEAESEAAADSNARRRAPPFSRSEREGDSIARPWSREESRYMKDAPVMSAVSYPVKVALLPEDRVFQQQDEPPTEESGREGLGLKPHMEREARRLQAQMLSREEEINIPFPRLVPPAKKEPKVEYELKDAIRHVKANTKCKFDETVEAHVLLGVNAKRGDQMVRGGAPLPHGIGKAIRVAVFADGDAANEAKAAGADVVGGDELVNEIKEGGLKGNFDKCIATPTFMPRLGKIGKVLGPRGLMPNPKAGTVTNDVAAAVREAKKGRVDFKMDKTAIVHAGLGKASFKEEALFDNIAAFLQALIAAKPVGLKNTSRYAGYIKTFTLTSTMGPGFRVSIQSLTHAADQYMKLRVH